MTAAVAASRTVPRLRAAALAYRVLLRQMVNLGRLLFLALLGASMILVGWAVGSTQQVVDLSEPDVDQGVKAAVQLVSGLGLAVIVPIVALVFASASFGDTREDGTLVYLWLRPMHRGPVVVGAHAASLTVVLPLTVVPVVAGAALADSSVDVIVASAVASTVGAVAYSALFVLLGLLIKRAIVWGLAYILVWEGISAALGTAAARLAIRGYTRSILTDVTGVDLELGDLSAAAGVIVPLLVAGAALVLATVRLAHLDVA